MPPVDELVAKGRTEAEVEALRGIDLLIYQDLADLEEAVSGPKRKVTKFDSSCFNGEYVTGVEPGYFDSIKQLRSDDAKRSEEHTSKLQSLMRISYAVFCLKKKKTRIIKTLV